MKLQPFSNMRNRLTFWFTLLTLVPLLTALIITYFQRVDVIEENAFYKLTALRDLKVQQIRNWLLQKSGDMRIISTDRELSYLSVAIQCSPQQPPENLAGYANHRWLIRRYLDHFPDYVEIQIINPLDGRILVSTSQYKEGDYAADSEYFQDTLGKGDLSISGIYYSTPLNKYIITFAIPIFCTSNSPRQIIGILVAHVGLQNSLYAMLLDRVGLGKTGETLIIDSDVYALNELRWHSDAPLKLQIEAEPAVRAAAGGTGTIKSADYRGKKVLAAYTYIPEIGWGFVCKQDMDELYIPVRAMLRHFIILFLTTAAFLIPVILFLGRSISRPLSLMAAVAGKIRAGDYTARTTVHRRDELGALGLAFNKMTDTTSHIINVQQGVMAVSKAIAGKSTPEAFASSLISDLVRLTNCHLGVFYVLEPEDGMFIAIAATGALQEALLPFQADPPEGELAQLSQEKKIHYLEDIPPDTVFQYKTASGNLIPQSIATLPVLKDDQVMAFISLASLRKFGDRARSILEQSMTNITAAYLALLATEKTRKMAETLQMSYARLEAQSLLLKSQTEKLQALNSESNEQAEELTKQNRELEFQRKQIEEANRLKSEFLSNMSHELRTPLNSVLALSRILIQHSGEKLSEEEREYLGIIERNGTHLLNLINNILDLSKIEAGKMDVNITEFSPEDILEAIFASLKPMAEQKGIALLRDSSSRLPRIRSDESKVFQILQNIISNGVKFTNKGYVKVITSNNTREINIAVTDTGIGISSDDLPYIFDEFRQVDGSSSRKFEGSGLGLAIAYKALQLIRGTVKVSSTSQEGTTFLITIPLDWPAEEEGFQAPGNKPVDATFPAGFSPHTPVRNPARILLVEDNESAVIQIKHALKSREFSIDVAENGEMALKYIRHTIPDGIILDLMMPGIDGFQVLDELRGTEQTTHIPILILTAKDLSAEDLNHLHTNNINQLIFKGDIDKEGLIDKMRLMLGLHGEQVPLPSSPPVVLVVEDNPDNLITLKAICAGMYTILEARNGQEGLRLALSAEPAIIVMDIALPLIDGFELVRHLKADSKTDKIPVIALTARAMKGDKELILAAGFDAYLSKPVNADLLLQTLQSLLIK